PARGVHGCLSSKIWRGAAGDIRVPGGKTYKRKISHRRGRAFAVDPFWFARCQPGLSGIYLKGQGSFRLDKRAGKCYFQDERISTQLSRVLTTRVRAMPMDERKKKVLLAIVKDFISTAEPVGS